MNSIQPSGISETDHAPKDEWTTAGGKMPHSQREKLDFIDMLPEEIWIPIIAESASQMRSIAGIAISQDTLLDLMQVSRNWSTRISSSPILWVDIILENRWDSAAKAALALHYSQQAPISLYMYSPTGWWDALQEHLLANRTRITKLYMHSGSFSPILRQLSPLPSLASLHHGPLPSFTEKDDLGYLLDSPIAWTNFWLDRGILERRSTRELREIRVGCELEDVFDLLQGSEYLREVLVQPGFIAQENKPTLNVKDSLLHGPALPWKTLNYHSDRDSLLGALIARLPKLVELRIQVSQQIFCSLMPLIFQLENLSIFDVTMRGEWDRLEHLVIPRASTSVREAAVYIDRDASLVMEPMVDTLFRCLPNVRHLRLQVAHFPTIRMLTSSTGFQYLETLLLDVTLDQGDIPSDGVLGPFATSVEQVSYWINGPCSKPLIPLQSHHIRHLEIYCLILSELDMYSQRWTAIRTIELDYNVTVNWKGPTYQHLHTISCRNFFGGPGGRNATKVCRDIALHPEYFPALTKLEFDACPELDILFILLGTRNLVNLPGISPIATLVIPRRYPPFLVERLRELVKGVEHGASSYYDLSIAGNYDIITDPSITGCADCHRALRFCKLPVRRPGSPVPTLVMEYPESATEILESWDVRAEKWYPVENILLRSSQCGRSFPSVSITG